MEPEWRVLKGDERAEELSRAMGLPPVFGQLLINRGVQSEAEAERFLHPSLGGLSDPFLMKGMEEGIERMVKAILSGEGVTVFGDYDVDGITSVALLKHFLASAGLKVDHYIPKRLEEGYGLNVEAVQEIASRGTGLLVTVDCGISDREEIALARDLGMDVIVLDHHEPPDDLPRAVIINPMQRDCPYPFKGLAGVGVTFAFVMALRRRLRELGHWRRFKEPNLKRYLDLVALGTVADIVPVTGENRILLKFGLKELQETERPGLIALKEVSGLDQSPIGYGQVAFRLAPRLNAGGRMQREEVPLKLLLTDDLSEARRLAGELEEANRQRQAIQEKVYREAREMALKGLSEAALVLSSEGWHPGVIGIVASKLAEEFWRPTILIAIEGEEGKGSARSIPEIHLREALDFCRHHLLAFGGHRLAAGLKVRREDISPLRDAFCRAVKEALGGAEPVPLLYIDAELPLREITPRFIQMLELLHPFGPGNPRPLFCCPGEVNFEGLRRFNNGVTRFSVRDESGRWEAIAFSGLEDLPSRGKIAFYPTMEEWEGYKRLLLEVRALKASDGP